MTTFLDRLDLDVEGQRQDDRQKRGLKKSRLKRDKKGLFRQIDERTRQGRQKDMSSVRQRSLSLVNNKFYKVKCC